MVQFAQEMYQYMADELVKLEDELPTFSIDLQDIQKNQVSKVEL